MLNPLSWETNFTTPKKNSLIWFLNRDYRSKLSKDIFLSFNFLQLSQHPYSYRWVLVQLLHLLLEKQWNIYIYACWCMLKWISIWYKCWHLWFTSICTFHWLFCIHFMFSSFCAQNWFVFDANFNAPDNQNGLFFKYQIILACCLYVQINSIKIE